MEQNPKVTKNMFHKDLSPNKIKTVVSNFYLKSLINHVNKSYWMQQCVYDFTSS